MGCIYRIVCHATGRSYIGQTSYSNPFERYKQHQRTALKGKEDPLYEDMRKYGMNEFECICICVVENSLLNALECYYAEQYDAYVWDGGYNIRECGNEIIRRDVSDERRKWMRHRAVWKNMHR